MGDATALAAENHLSRIVRENITPMAEPSACNDFKQNASPIKPSVANAPSVSVIICTCDRAASLLATLRSLANLELDDIGTFELVVVDNGSKDDSASAIAGFAQQAPFNVRYVRERTRGLGVARNAGLSAAMGEVLLWTDDDCIVPGNWVNLAAQLFSRDLMQVVGGRVELFNPAHLPITIKTSRTRERMKWRGDILGFMHGCNMAFGRPVIDRIGHFDQRFGAGSRLRSAEDSDFIYRACQAGVPICYEPDLLVYHNHGRIGALEHRRLSRGYGVGLGAAAIKHWRRGDPDLMKAWYWKMRPTIRRWRTGQIDRSWLAAQAGWFSGVLFFLIGDLFSAQGFTRDYAKKEGRNGHLGGK